MNGVFLKFYVHENRRLHGILGYEWLLEKARAIGIHGGSAFRALAGFGHNGVMHEDHFFELAGDLPVEVAFALEPAEADRLLAEIAREGVTVFYVRLPCEFGTTAG